MINTTLYLLYILSQITFAADAPLEEIHLTLSCDKASFEERIVQIHEDNRDVLTHAITLTRSSEVPCTQGEETSYYSVTFLPPEISDIMKDIWTIDHAASKTSSHDYIAEDYGLHLPESFDGPIKVDFVIFTLLSSNDSDSEKSIKADKDIFIPLTRSNSVTGWRQLLNNIYNKLFNCLLSCTPS